MHQQRVVPDFGGVKSAELSPRAMRECINKKMVPDFGGVKIAELSPRAIMECINKEWCQTLVGSRAQS